MKTCFKNQRIGKFSCKKSWPKSQRNGVYIGQTLKLAVGCFYSLDGWRSTARSTANGHKYDRWRNPIVRPVDRPKQRAKLSGRSTARSTAQVPGQRAQVCARRSTDSGSGRPVGRPDERAVLSVFGRSTGFLQRSKNRSLAVDRPVDRQPPGLTKSPNG